MKSKSKFFIVVLIAIILAITGYFGYHYLKNKNMFENLSAIYFAGQEMDKQVGKTEYDIEYNYHCSHSIEYPSIGNDKITNKIKSEVDLLKNNFAEEHKEEDAIEELEDATLGISYYQYITYKSYVAPENKMGLVLEECQTVGDTNVILDRVFTYNFDLTSGNQLANSDIFKDGYKEQLSKVLKKYFTEKEEYKDVVDLNAISNNENNLNKFIITNDNIIVYFDKYEVLPGNFNIVSVEVSYDDMKDYLKINKVKKTEIPESNVGINSKEAEVKFTDVNETVYTKTNLNVRTEPNVKSEKKGTVSMGTEVNRIGIGDNGWSKVKYKNEIAYMSSAYLVKEKPVEPQHTTVEITVDGERKVDPSKPMVALTFDDGPNPNSTPKILDTLEKYNVVATFFDLGTCMANYPKITQRAESLGCEIGSHTYSHQNLNELSSAQINEDMQKAQDVYKRVLGHDIHLVRTPYGNANKTVKATLKYPIISWDIDTLDWKSRNANSVLAEIRKYSNYDGRIILMHSIYDSTAEAVETIVPELMKKGYQLVTVSELAKYKGKNLQTGTVYYDFR